MIGQEARQYLLKLAREAIEHYPKKPDIDPKRLSPELLEKRAVFVTLTIDGALRGCIGSLLPQEKLYLSVLHHARHAAYQDPRFPRLDKTEYKKTRIEISILSLPEPVQWDTLDDLLSQLDHTKGVIITYGGRSATFLPQVWEQLPEKEDFLVHLCQKAGLPGTAWQDRDARIETYTVQSFEET